MVVGFHLVYVVVIPAVKKTTFAEKCPLNWNGQFNKREFFIELWTPKPKYKSPLGNLTHKNQLNQQYQLYRQPGYIN